MKNLIFLTSFIAVIFLVACGESANQSTKMNEAPTPTPVSNEIAVEAKETKMATTKISEEAKEKTTIIQQSEVSVVVKKESASKTANSKKSPTKKVKKEASQPTKPKSTPSVSTTNKVDKVEEEVAAPPKKEETKPVVEIKKSLNHDAWNALLQKNVSSSGKVNYKGFKSQQSALDSYLADLAANAPTNSTPRKEAMAYWINAYNAFTVKLIVQNYPVSSITKLENGKPWDKKWIKLGDKTYSLNNIENDILRPKYKDARIHFAVNCAAQSCPPILNKAWTASNLNANFEKQAKAFINNSKFNKISADAVEISKIFEWYSVDFGNIIEYLNKYSTTKINANAKVSYMEYDWALNQ